MLLDDFLKKKTLKQLEKEFIDIFDFKLNINRNSIEPNLKRSYGIILKTFYGLNTDEKKQRYIFNITDKYTNLWKKTK